MGAASSSVISICNGALVWVGGKILVSGTASLDSPTNTIERTLSQKFDRSCRKVLRSAPFVGVQKRAELTESTTPAFGFDKSFSLPTDFVRVNGIWLDESYYDLSERSAWRREGRLILTNASTVQITYNWYPPLSHAESNNSTWNSYFALLDDDVKDLIELSLAIAICTTVTGGNTSLESKLSQYYAIGKENALFNSDSDEDNPNAYPDTLLCSRI